METTSKTINWGKLLKEFEVFEPDKGILEWDAVLFSLSLLQPVPGFVQAFIDKKHPLNVGDDEAARALYSFLLEKRYEEKLNLLHFAFNIFDESSLLPREVIDRTPFPHEEGIPKFTHINDPNFTLDVKPG
jgi:hypothetical protein